MKKILKYICIYILVVLICLLSLIGTATIPKENIKKSMLESANYYKKLDGIHKPIGWWISYSYLHYYGDTILLNMIYCIDSNNPIQSVMWSKYYEEIVTETNEDFIKAVEEDKEGNQEYLRYWHGSMAIIRPLMTIFNIQQIYTLNTVCLFTLIIILTIILYKKYPILAIAFFAGLIMIGILFVPMCLEYTWSIIIMVITSIISILIEKNRSNLLNSVFLVTGMLTCFFDFLTTEILTIMIPILLICCIRYKEDRLKSIKESLKFIIVSSLFWFIGYAGMWITKWIIASLVLNINAFDYVTDQALLRIGANYTGNTVLDTRIIVLRRNVVALFPIAHFRKHLNEILIGLLLLIVFLGVLIVNWRKIKQLWFSIVLLLIGITPYIRYELLLNHSYNHSFFTFRIQLITIICLIMIIVNLFEAQNNWITKITLKIKRGEQIK